MAFLFLFIILHLFIFFCVFVNNYENNMITSLIFVYIFKWKILTIIYINDNIYKKICFGVFLCKKKRKKTIFKSVSWRFAVKRKNRNLICLSRERLPLLALRKNTASRQFFSSYFEWRKEK